jgi:hypothetical protein
VLEQDAVRRNTEPPNKELKLTKPSIMELRSLTPVFDRPMWTHESKVGC